MDPMSPLPDHFEVLAFNGAWQTDAVLRWEGDDRDHDYTVTAEGPWGRFSGRAGDCFEALIRVREQLEPLGWFLGVNGSRRDTWPSGMCRGMGGFLVYHLTPFVRLTSADRIETFLPAPRETLATIADQIAFEKYWQST
jgi:hypothetical protein